MSPDKFCHSCAQIKPHSEFHKRAASRDGYRKQCKACISLKLADWDLAYRDTRNAAARAARAADPEPSRRKVREWRERNPDARVAYEAAHREQRAAISRRWRARNPADAAALIARRKATQRGATPGWANPSLIKDFYRLARIWSEATGEAFHVDHVVPLRSSVVCGLHCPANLQVLPAFDNHSKGNRWWPDMP